MSSFASWPALPDALADRVVAQIELLRERLVDDGHLRRAERIGARELPAGHQRDAHGAEVAGADAVERSVGVGVGPGLEALDHEAVAPVVAGEHRHHRRDHAGHAGNGGDLVFDALEQLPCALGRVRVELRRDAEQHHVSAFNPRSTRLTLKRLFANKPGRHEQRHRHGDLHGGERRAEPPRGFGAAGLSGLVLERSGEIRTRAVQRGEQAERNAGHDRRDGGEPQHGRAQRKRDQALGVGRQDRRDQIERPLRHEQAGHGAKRRQQDRLGHQLRDQLAAVGADREAHRHFRGAAGAAYQQQVRDVGARDQQHGAGDRQQDDQRRARFVVEAALAAIAALGRDLLRLEPRHRLVAHALLQRRFDVVDDRVIGAVDGDGGLLDRNARLQAPEKVGPVLAAVLESVESRLTSGRASSAARRCRRHCRAWCR